MISASLASKFFRVFLLAAAAAVFFCVRGFAALQADAVSIQWLGQSCFVIDAPSGKQPYRILIDPYGPQVGYPVHRVRADLVFVSHEHFDHNNTGMAPGAEIIRGLSVGAKAWAKVNKRLAPGISLRTVGVYHDPAGGKEFGLNSVSVFDIHGLAIVHLGDLGHLLAPREIASIGPVDVLMIPVGGTYTIDGAEAVKVAEHLHPKVIIPIHYKTKYVRLPLHTADEFLGKSPWPVHKLRTDTLLVSRDRLPAAAQVYVLEPLAGARRPFRL